MHKLYTPATIADFKMVQEYTARYITMDKIPGAPTYVWHKQQFTGSDGQTSEIRIGMNTSGLSPAQKNLLDQFYQLTDKLRTPDFIDISYYDNPSSELLLEKIKDKTYRLLNTTDPLKQQFHWLEMLLNMASEIIRNSPLPITIADQDGNIRNISPAYAAGTGYTIAQI